MRLSYNPVKFIVKKRSTTHPLVTAAANRSAIARLLIKRLFLAALLLAPGLASNHAPAQTTNIPAGKPIVIDATKNIPSTLDFHLGDNFPQGETSIEIKSDSKSWRFIMFNKLPATLRLSLKGKLRGYAENEELKQDLWYQFKDTLPVQLAIGQQTTSPLELSIKLGIAKNPSLLEEKNADDVRELAKNNINNNNVILPAATSTIKLMWGQPAPPPTPSPTLSPDPDILDDISAVLKSRVFMVILSGVTFIGLIMFLRSMGLFKNLSMWYQERKQSHNNKGPGTGSQPSEQATGTRRDIVTYKDGKVEHSSSSSLGRVVGENLDRQLPVGAPQITQQDIAGLETRLEKKMAALKEEFKKDSKSDLAEILRKELRNKWDRNDTSIYTSIKSKVVETIVQETGQLQGDLRAHREGIDARLRELDKKIEGLQTKHQDEAKEVQEQLQHVKQEQQVILNNFERAVAKRQQVEKRFDQIERAIEAKANDLFYARMLGVLLENKVDALSETGFNDLFGRLEEKLNGFFRDEIARSPGGLEELRQRADAIKEAFKKVVEKMPESADGDNDAYQLAAQAAGIATDLSGLQSQLENRQLEVTTSLRIPIAVHASARRTFIEELALGLKREIDKLSDPTAYFENQLESLATSEVINLTDICDQRHGRKEGSELEHSLQELFVQANLHAIVPKRKEAFNTSEQELVEMVQGEPQDRLKVSEVLTRGFIYKRNGHETLLRKAGVKVYR